MDGILEQILQELKEIKNQLHGINSLILNAKEVFNMAKTDETLPDAITVDDIKAYLHIGTTRAYRIINLPSFIRINLGRKASIPKDQFLEWVKRERQKKAIGIKSKL